VAIEVLHMYNVRCNQQICEEGMFPRSNITYNRSVMKLHQVVLTSSLREMINFVENQVLCFRTKPKPHRNFFSAHALNSSKYEI